jgi:hypothetical protein
MKTQVTRFTQLGAGKEKPRAILRGRIASRITKTTVALEFLSIVYVWFNDAQYDEKPIILGGYGYSRGRKRWH